MTDRLSINEWAEEDRPREKLISQGASALTNAELLAILIGSGNAEDSAVELMRKVMAHYNNSLSMLGKCTVEELCQFKGIGPAKAVTILAASELGKRRKEEEPPQRRVIHSSEDIYSFFYPLLCDLPVEEFWVLLLNQASRVIDAVKIGQGGIVGVTADVRRILREAIVHNAPAFVVCHNHPSGNIRPSSDDNSLTRSLREAAKTMSLRLLDHVILTDGAYYSYNDEGTL